MEKRKMAFAFATEKEQIKIISIKDSSLDKSVKDFETVFENYRKTLDESLLTFLPGVTTTRFVLNTELKYKAQQILENMKVKIQDGEAVPQLGFMMEEVRLSLVDIENPDGKIAFKKESDGYASKDLIALLNRLGIAGELYLVKSMQSQVDAEAAKKN